MARMRRLGGLTALYAVVAALAVAAPLSASEEPPPPPETASADPAAPAPAPAAEPAPAPAEPAQPAPPAQAAPAPPTPPAEQAAPAPAAPAPAAPAAPAAEPQVLREDEPAAGAKTKDKLVAVAAASTGVTISDFKFSPAGVTVNVGDTVTWSNNGPTGHSATASDGSFDTGILDKGSSGSHTFTQAGTFNYICTPHPFMKGTVTVVAAAADNGGGSGGGDTGSTSGTTSTDSQADSGPALPSTGMDVGGLLVLGLATLALGGYLRRRTAPEPPRPAGRIGW
jgi:LPXTG-motif cell wall-anchored protein